jgi:hypothetical protein
MPFVDILFCTEPISPIPTLCATTTQEINLNSQQLIGKTFRR